MFPVIQIPDSPKNRNVFDALILDFLSMLSETTIGISHLLSLAIPFRFMTSSGHMPGVYPIIWRHFMVTKTADISWFRQSYVSDSTRRSLYLDQQGRSKEDNVQYVKKILYRETEI